MIRPLVALSALCLATPAAAELRLCNKSDVPQSVAVGYKDGDTWVSEGWWQIAPGDCATPIRAELSARYYYYAVSAPGQQFDGEGYMFCTDSAAFTIEGDTECEARGYTRRSFRAIDTGTDALAYTFALRGEGLAPEGAPEAPAPGTYGEPFATRALLQGCDVIDGAEYCEFMADGFRYWAWYDNGTADALLDRLQDAAPLGTFDIEGDIVNFGDVTAEVVLRRVTEATPDALAGIRRAMQGAWQSTIDPASRIEISGLYIDRVYDGAFLGTAMLSVAEACEDSHGAGPVLIETEMSADADRLCLVIDSLTGGEMVLFLAGSGQEQRYRRVE